MKRFLRWFLMRLGVRPVRLVAFDIQECDTEGDYRVEAVFRHFFWATPEDHHTARSELMLTVGRILGGRVRLTSPVQVQESTELES